MPLEIIPSLSDYLSSNGWVVINDNLMICDEKNLAVKISDGTLCYRVNNKTEEEIPLEIIIHFYRRLITNTIKYQKALKLINALKSRDLEICYSYCNYHWNGNDGNKDWAAFNLLSIRTEESIITLENDGCIRIYTQWNHGRYNEDEIIKEIIIELGLIINSDFHYDRKLDKFDISEANRKRLIKENNDYFESF